MRLRNGAHPGRPGRASTADSPASSPQSETFFGIGGVGTMRIQGTAPTAITAGSVAPRAPVSVITRSGTTTGPPGSSSNSRSPTWVRKISGEAFTTRLEITLDVLLHLFDVDLTGLDLGVVQRHQKVPTAKAGYGGGL